MQVLAEGKWRSSAGRIVTEGMGWNPSSDAGKAGDPVQKNTKSCFSIGDIFSTIDHSHLKSDIASSQYYKKHKSPVTLQKLHQHYKYVAFFESA